jgi:hypothetical protein
METKRAEQVTHELKIWPEFFEQTRNGRKKFELRQNDRDFQVGDQLLLKEWEPPKSGETYFDDDFHYTGRELLVRVDYIMQAEDATFVGTEKTSPINAGFVIMSISLPLL